MGMTRSQQIVTRDCQACAESSNYSTAQSSLQYSTSQGSIYVKCVLKDTVKPLAIAVTMPRTMRVFTSLIHCHRPL